MATPKMSMSLSTSFTKSSGHRTHTVKVLFHSDINDHDPASMPCLTGRYFKRNTGKTIPKSEEEIKL